MDEGRFATSFRNLVVFSEDDRIQLYGERCVFRYQNKTVCVNVGPQ